MVLHRSAHLAVFPLLLALSPVQAADAPPPAPAAAPAPEAAAPQFSVNQPFGDWAVRCALETVKSPAPCDVIQLTVNQDSKQRIMSFSLAFVPSRDSYALQIVVPTGVALARGLSMANGDHSLNQVKYNRCERDGCYVELLLDAPTVATMQASGGDGKSTNVTIVSYGQFNTLNLPVSLKGFPEAVDRMKTLARQRAIALPAAPGAAAAAPAGRGGAAPAGGRAPGRAPARGAAPAAPAPGR